VVKFKGKPDAGNPHVRFDEGEGGCLPPYSTLDLDDPGAHHEHVPGPQFAAVAQMLLHRGHAAIFASQVRGGHPHQGEQVPGGLVEFPHEPHHIHVAHVIALPGVDDAAVGDGHFLH